MAETRFPWPGNRTGAISLTFDDGLASQLAVAVPTLNQVGLQGTFYLSPGPDYEQALSPWREVAAAGHELGNHTISHPCAYNAFSKANPVTLALEDMILDELEAEIVEASRRLRALVPQQSDISFAYPCYQSFVGRGLTRQSYVPLVARHCIAGRGFGEYPLANDPDHCDLAYLWAWPCERMSATELLGLAERTAAVGRWGIMVFHGVHEGHLSITEGDLAELCALLAARSDRIWTAPVATVARWVREQRDGRG